MQLGVIGLGRMAANIVAGLQRAGRECEAKAEGRSRRPSMLRWVAPVLIAALFARFASRGEDDFANGLLSALRGEFGADLEKVVDEEPR
jgi:6-phosphogluconate dehydrogenase (decarboxylating)